MSMFLSEYAQGTDMSGVVPAANAAWYVVHCLPLKERYAAMGLRNRLDLTVYLPEVQRAFRGQLLAAPLFPRYLFIKADLGVLGISRINAMPGVARLVTFDDLPQPIPTAVIRGLYEQVERLNAHGGLPNHDFQPGERVQINAGPLKGLDAVFIGPRTPSERVQILLEFMGRLHQLELDARQVERIDAPQTPREGRATRGRGRRIGRLRD